MALANTNTIICHILPGPQLYTWVESSNVDKLPCWRTKVPRRCTGKIRTRALSVRVEWILQYTTTPPPMSAAAYQNEWHIYSSNVQTNFEICYVTLIPWQISLNWLLVFSNQNLYFRNETEIVVFSVRDKNPAPSKWLYIDLLVFWR